MFSTGEKIVLIKYSGNCIIGIGWIASLAPSGGPVIPNPPLGFSGAGPKRKQNL